MWALVWIKRCMVWHTEKKFIGPQLIRCNIWSIAGDGVTWWCWYLWLFPWSACITHIMHIIGEPLPVCCLSGWQCWHGEGDIRRWPWSSSHLPPVSSSRHSPTPWKAVVIHDIECLEYTCSSICVRYPVCDLCIFQMSVSCAVHYIWQCPTHPPVPHIVNTVISILISRTGILAVLRSS